MDQRDLQSLLEKYSTRSCSPEEIAMLESWYYSRARLEKLPVTEEELSSYKELIWKNIQQNVHIAQPQSLEKGFYLWKSVSVAASIAILVFISGYYLIGRHSKLKSPLTVTKAKLDILPGTNKATLMLSDGRKISLADIRAGLIAQEGSVTIKKSDQDILSYKQISDGGQEGGLARNTISTPNGGQWPVIELPDGTKAFLDAASSISFPLSFNRERKVAITGQVYFEVVHNAKKPFRVTVKGVTVEDIGTSFNVNAYDNESGVQTTLVEGSIQVSQKDQKITINPGQQAIVLSGNGKIISRDVNVEYITAWKKGLFQFDHTGIEMVMKQIARWYNVEIDYQTDVSNLSFTGNLSRNLKLSRLLEILNVTGLDFKIENKKIIITG